METDSDLCLTPQGALRIEPITAPSCWPEPEASARLAKVLSETPARGLLHLATRELNTLLPPAAGWWREFGRRYLTQLCHTQGLEQVRQIPPLPPPAEVELAAL